ncbi:dienelactone hydrolase family protein [Phenylobacterium aquaticum]|uniref:dienelactone hydrolase family protein n=1 Tax=Phenylobacterium aquaticum TaxID=1763816 RepID=UPI0026F247AC|nr:dienelactone hydrolase family protein [Phenylobacterium aquaticum]
MSLRTAYVAFATKAEPALTVAGKLAIPSAETKVPAVILCHGSDGVDGRGEFYRPALNAAGIATLEIDMWAARGSARGAAARPRSPIETLPDAFAAKRFLAEQPEIDAARIGIMGFSWGAVVTLLSATPGALARFGDGQGAFKAHMANYPVVWAYETVPGLSLAELTGAPILIQCGDADTYDDPDGLDQLMARLPEASRNVIRGVTYPGAGHGFDRDLPAQTINDPFAHKGKGGPVVMEFNPGAATASRDACVTFFSETL